MIKQLHCAAALMMFAMASAGSAGTKVSSDSKVTARPLDLTIYHLEGRRSERIVWLCEELGIPYKLEYKRGDLAASSRPLAHATIRTICNGCTSPRARSPRAS
jgi:hypothetical protein